MSTEIGKELIQLEVKKKVPELDNSIVKSKCRVKSAGSGGIFSVIYKKFIARIHSLFFKHKSRGELETSSNDPHILNKKLRKSFENFSKIYLPIIFSILIPILFISLHLVYNSAFKFYDQEFKMWIKYSRTRFFGIWVDKSDLVNFGISITVILQTSLILYISANVSDSNNSKIVSFQLVLIVSSTIFFVLSRYYDILFDRGFEIWAGGLIKSSPEYIGFLVDLFLFIAVGIQLLLTIVMSKYLFNKLILSNIQKKLTILMINEK